VPCDIKAEIARVGVLKPITGVPCECDSHQIDEKPNYKKDKTDTQQFQHISHYY
jgi:hypothetical protein